MEECISPDTDGTQCHKLAVIGSKFCEMHIKIFRSDYMKYKRLEQSVFKVFERNSSDDYDIYELLRNYHRLSTAYDLRLSYRERAIHPKHWDGGHDFRLTLIHRTIEMLYQKILDFFTKDGTSKLEVTLNDEDDVTRKRVFEVADIKKKMKVYKRQKYDVDMLVKNVKREINDGAVSNIKENVGVLTLLMHEILQPKIGELLRVLKWRYAEMKKEVDINLGKFAMFLYGVIYPNVSCQLKSELVYYTRVGIPSLVASPVIQLAVDEYIHKNMVLLESMFHREGSTFESIYKFFQQLPESMIKYLFMIYYEILVTNGLFEFRLYRSGIKSCSMVITSNLPPKIIRAVHIPYLKGSYCGYESVIINFLSPEEEPNNEPFKNYKTSITEKALISYHTINSSMDGRPLGFMMSEGRKKCIVGVQTRSPIGVIVKEDFDGDLYLQYGIKHLLDVEDQEVHSLVGKDVLFGMVNELSKAI